LNSIYLRQKGLGRQGQIPPDKTEKKKNGKNPTVSGPHTGQGERVMMSVGARFRKGEKVLRASQRNRVLISTKERVAARGPFRRVRGLKGAQS